MGEINVKIRKLHPDAKVPAYATELAAGFDLVAVEDVTIAPGETALVPTGLAFEIPPGYEMQIRPRSGISLRTKLRVANSPGTGDADFRGEVKVIVDNIALPSFYINETYMTIGLEFGRFPLKIDGKRDDSISDEQEYTYIIRKGDRIAQAVIAPIMRATFEVADELSESERGAGGFGSTGVIAQ